jgi:hypothetical protein
MSIESGSVLIIDINGIVMAVTPGSAIPANTTAFLVAGTDGTNARTMLMDTSGRPVLVGAGVAGTPSGGVISIQGVSGGTTIPVSGTVTATFASVGLIGSTAPTSGDYSAGSDGTNLVGFRMKAASTAAVAADPSLVVALSPNSPIPTGANVIGAVTQSGTWTNTVTQATAANLNALVAQGAAGTAAAGWFVKLTDGTNTAPTFDVAARAGFQKITDGTNTAAVKAASTAPVATDPSLVVVISPNQPSIPVTVAAGVDRTSTGSITTTQNVAINTQSSGTCGIQVTGTWTGTLVFEASVDNGTTWVSINATVPVTGVDVTSTTANGVWSASVAGFAQLRVRGNTVATGTAVVFLDSATGTMIVSLGDPLPAGTATIGAVNQGTAAALAGKWPVQVTDGTNVMPTMDTVTRKGFHAITDGTNGPAAVKAASTAAVAADPSLVVSLSPNNPIPTGANVIGAVTQGAGSGAPATFWYARITDGTNTMPTMDVVARKGFHAITDGTNTAAVKAASTAAVATDPALVVAISPNNTILTSNASVGATGSAPPASATYIGAFDGTNLVGLRLKPASTAAVAADPSLVVALSPNSPIPTGANVIGAVTQSGTWSVTATQATAANLNATVVQTTAANLNATVTGSGTGGTPAAGVVTIQGISTMTPVITTEKRSSTSAVTSVASSVTNVNLLAANANRIGALITNDGTQVLFVKLGTTASATSYTYRLTANSQAVVDAQWTGNIDGIWNNANGSARITELT